MYLSIHHFKMLIVFNMYMNYQILIPRVGSLIVYTDTESKDNKQVELNVKIVLYATKNRTKYFTSISKIKPPLQHISTHKTEDIYDSHLCICYAKTRNCVLGLETLVAGRVLCCDARSRRLGNSYCCCHGVADTSSIHRLDSPLLSFRPSQFCRAPITLFSFFPVNVTDS